MMEPAERASAIELYRSLLEAWNRRSAREMAALFAEDGSSVGFDGSSLNGRAEIAGALEAIFVNHPTAAYVAKVREVRSLGTGVTLLRAVAGMCPPAATKLKPALNAVQSLVIVSGGGKPEIALLQNTPAAFHGRPDLAGELTRELTEVLRSGRIVAAE